MYIPDVVKKHKQPIGTLYNDEEDERFFVMSCCEIYIARANTSAQLQPKRDLPQSKQIATRRLSSSSPAVEPVRYIFLIHISYSSHYCFVCR
jgi:hypothetical protein